MEKLFDVKVRITGFNQVKTDTTTVNFITFDGDVLLRGINISGKNKISMPELKTAIGEKGFGDVKTYLNSGNVISQDELKCLLSKASSWWGSDSKDIYDNLIFAIAPYSIETVVEKIGEPTAALEKVELCENAAF